MSENKKTGSDIGGMVCGGCMFIGYGVGWLLGINAITTGAIGLGVGLIAMAAIVAYYRQKEQ